MSFAYYIFREYYSVVSSIILPDGAKTHIKNPSKKSKNSVDITPTVGYNSFCVKRIILLMRV